MPKAPNENRAKAERMFKEGMALVEIAGKLGISEGTVRSWKARYWSKDPEDKKIAKNVATFATKKKKSCNVAKRKKGGQPGNKNALKHGGYSNIFYDSLDEEELEMIMDMPEDEELLLIDEIRTFTLRERRILKAINWYRKKKEEEPLTIAGVSRQEEKRQFKNEEERLQYEALIAEKVENGTRMPGTRYNIVTNTEPKDSAIARLEKELSVVQGKKTQAIQVLADLRLEKTKLNGDSNKDDLVQAWIAGLTGGE